MRRTGSAERPSASCAPNPTSCRGSYPLAQRQIIPVHLEYIPLFQSLQERSSRRVFHRTVLPANSVSIVRRPGRYEIYNLKVRGDSSEVKEVTYTLGIPSKENCIYYLGHNHVLDLFGRLLDNQKFRRVFASKYPLILIDEYQDTNRNIINKFIEYFISQNTGPQFGFFGDAWQTIYQFNNACGLIEHENLEVINKSVNFRSAPRIVEVLNRLRKDLPQVSAIDNIDGEVIAVTCDDYKGIRQKGGYFNGELPSNELKARIGEIRKKIQRELPEGDSLKILMITHKTLAIQQGYEQLLNILGQRLKEKDDPFLVFFMDIVEPIYRALKSSNTQLLFKTLGISRFPIRKKSDKVQWRVFLSELEEARKKKGC